MPKIRGLRRRGRSIERWRLANLHINANSIRDEARPYQDKTCYIKLWMEPWGNLFATEQPKKGHRTQMLNALLDIYESWRVQLTETQQPYYLKVWLFDPHFMRSQVVCAWGEAHDFYRNTFTPADAPAPIPLSKFDGMDERIAQFDWETHLEEQHYFESDFEDVGPDGGRGDLADQKALLERLKTKGYPSSEVSFMGKQTRAFAVPLGHVWLGERLGK